MPVPKNDGIDGIDDDDGIDGVDGDGAGKLDSTGRHGDLPVLPNFFIYF